MQYTGTVKVIGPKEEVGANALVKQTMVLEENTDREFKGGLAVDFFKEKTELLDGVKVGDMVTAYLNTRVNESKTTFAILASPDLPPTCTNWRSRSTP